MDQFEFISANIDIVSTSLVGLYDMPSPPLQWVIYANFRNPSGFLTSLKGLILSTVCNIETKIESGHGTVPCNELQLTWYAQCCTKLDISSSRWENDRYKWAQQIMHDSLNIVYNKLSGATPWLRSVLFPS